MTFDVVAFLSGLYASAPVLPPEPVARVLTVDDVPKEWRDFLRERTAIMRDDGRVPRDEAERLAIIETLAVAANWHLYPRF